MNLNLLSPYVRRAMHSVMKADFKIGQRIIFDYELIYLEHGECTVLVDGVTYPVKKGDFVFFRPGHPHTLQSSEGNDISQPHIHFDMCYDRYSESVYISFKDLADFTEDERKMIRDDLFDLPVLLKISDKETFLATFYDLIDTFEKKLPLYQLRCKEKMLALIAAIIKDNLTIAEPEGDDPLHAIIKHYIDYNFQSHITLESLEKQFHYSRFHISRTFLAYTGKTVIRYYAEKRLDYAKKLLDGGARISDIVEELNYGSIYSFSRSFKNETGLSPTEYKGLKK